MGVNHEHPRLSIVVGIDGWGGKLEAYKALLTIYLKAMRVDYAMVIDTNWAMEDDYMGFITSTLMYVTHERALRDEIQKLKDPSKE